MHKLSRMVELFYYWADSCRVVLVKTVLIKTIQIKTILVETRFLKTVFFKTDRLGCVWNPFTSGFHACFVPGGAACFTGGGDRNTSLTKIFWERFLCVRGTSFSELGILSLDHHSILTIEMMSS